MNKALACISLRQLRVVGWMPGRARVMLDAPSRAGRSVKISLFIAGAILPLGSLIWAGLLWYGLRDERNRMAVRKLPGGVGHP